MKEVDIAIWHTSISISLSLAAVVNGHVRFVHPSFRGDWSGYPSALWSVRTETSVSQRSLAVRRMRPDAAGEGGRIAFLDHPLFRLGMRIFRRCVKVRALKRRA